MSSELETILFQIIYLYPMFSFFQKTLIFPFLGFKLCVILVYVTAMNCVQSIYKHLYFECIFFKVEFKVLAIIQASFGESPEINLAFGVMNLKSGNFLAN